MNRFRTWFESPLRRAPSPILILVTVIYALVFGFCSGVTYANGVLR